MLIKIETTKMATAILFRWISLNSFTFFVRTEKSKNTEMFIMTAIIKPINKYRPEYFAISNASIASDCVVESRITLLMEGNISLNMSPRERKIPEVKIVKAIFSPCRLKTFTRLSSRILLTSIH